MSAKYPPKWADEPSDAVCSCGARAVIVYPMYGPLVLACSASGLSCERCTGQRLAASPTEPAAGPAPTDEPTEAQR